MIKWEPRMKIPDKKKKIGEILENDKKKWRKS